MTRIFIDGAEGTTGLRIRERLAGRESVSLISLPEFRRRELDARREALNDCDIAVLCLPDAAALEAVELVESPSVRIVDASTAHRTAPGWVYGFPELSPEREAAVAGAKRLAIPGCHASGFIALIHPLVNAGLIDRDAVLTCHSLTGYSGGGKKMIAEYRETGRDALLDAPRVYGLSQSHKHLPEMRALCGLTEAPFFFPVVAPYYSGMLTTIPLPPELLRGSIEDVRGVLRAAYPGPVVRWRESMDESGFMSSGAMSGSDAMEITCIGSAERPVLCARFDNLGKGASGACVECINIMTGRPSMEGLSI